MKTVKQACTPRAGVFDPARRDTVLDLGDLADGRIDPGEFFAENHVTEGMRTLLAEGFRRLEGKSAQGVFKLTQAMGGGKTHNLLALGLLAKHPEQRAEVMGAFYTPDPALGPVRVVAFSGRESDAPLGIWGAVAEQLGRKEQFGDYYAPLAAPGQTAWVNLLRGGPLVIMLDELPPYFVNAAAKSIGNSDLAAVTTTALSNLLVAVGRDELRNVCLVLSDLKASYGAGTARIGAALDDLEAETGRAAMNLEPVRMNTDEFYRILRKRLFEALPDGEEQVVAALADRQKYTTDAASETFRKKVEARLFTRRSMLWTEIRRRAATHPGWQWHPADALDRMKADCLHKDTWREEGSYVSKGPFPKPATAVRIRELHRDDDTGVVRLRLSPVHGDTLYAEVGAEATPASMKLDGRDFETADLRVSFLAADSTGEHDTGEPVEWRNRITLKSREYADGDARRVEIRAAPPAATIRYTTDGSDPRAAGGGYEGPFPVPDGARLILAVAEQGGIASDLHRREIAEKPVEKPIDPTLPTEWTRTGGFRYETTRAAYDFIARLKKARRQGERPAHQRPDERRRDVERGELLGRTRARRRAHRTDGRASEEARRRRRSLGRGQPRPLRDGPAVHRPRLGNQGRVQARRREAMNAEP